MKSVTTPPTAPALSTLGNRTSNTVAFSSLAWILSTVALSPLRMPTDTSEILDKSTTGKLRTRRYTEELPSVLPSHAVSAVLFASTTHIASILESTASYQKVAACPLALKVTLCLPTAMTGDATVTRVTVRVLKKPRSTVELPVDPNATLTPPGPSTTGKSTINTVNSCPPLSLP